MTGHRDGEVLLGVDVGTSSTKGVAATPDGALLARAARRHALSLPRPGYAEQDAEADWWQGCRDVMRELVDAVGAGAVQGVCVSGTGPCLVPCDPRGRPLRPAILYGIDTRASAEVAELESQLGRDAILARSRSALSSQALGPKLLWLRRNEPDVWSRMASWHMPSSLAALRLCGEWALDHHSASQCDPFYDLAAEDWARDWVTGILSGCPLPPLVWPGDRLGTVTAQAAAATGLRAGTPVLAGTIDAWSEAFSAGVRRPGDLMLMYGSTLFVVQVSDGRVPAAPPLWCTQGIEPGRPSYAGGMATSGTLLAWWRDMLGAPDWDTLLAEAAASPPGARGLLALPYFAGERTPIDDPRARGVIAGLSLRHTRGDVMRAAHEAIAFGVRGMLEALERAAGPARRVVAVGGGLQGGLLTQLVSDACGIEQLVPRETIGASYGDALLAAIGAGLARRDADWAHVTGSIAPGAEARAVYDELAPMHAQLYEATRPIVHPLAERETG